MTYDFDQDASDEPECHCDECDDFEILRAEDAFRDAAIGSDYDDGD